MDSSQNQIRAAAQKEIRRMLVQVQQRRREQRRQRFNWKMLPKTRCIPYYTRRGQRSEGHQRSHKGDLQIRRRGSQKESDWEVKIKSVFEELRNLKNIVV